jgi:large subunit ribosomal protein L35
MVDSKLPASYVTAGPAGTIRSDGQSAMPKQKTHKGTKKRFRITARGKIKHRQAGTSHLNSRMSKKRRRQLRGTDTLRSALDTKRLTIALAGNSY